MQFRADIFNLFNHPNFTNPDGGHLSHVSGLAGGMCADSAGPPSMPISGASAKPSPTRTEPRSAAALRAKRNFP